MSELDELIEPDSGGRSSRSTRLRILALFDFVGISAFFFCWGVIMTIPEWGRQVPRGEFDYRIPIRGYGNFYVDPWFGHAIYASALIVTVYIPLRVLSDKLRKSTMAKPRDASVADSPENSERDP